MTWFIFAMVSRTHFVGGCVLTQLRTWNVFETRSCVWSTLLFYSNCCNDKGSHISNCCCVFTSQKMFLCWVLYSSSELNSPLNAHFSYLCSMFFTFSCRLSCAPAKTDTKPSNDDMKSCLTAWAWGLSGSPQPWFIFLSVGMKISESSCSTLFNRPTSVVSNILKFTSWTWNETKRHTRPKGPNLQPRIPESNALDADMLSGSSIQTRWALQTTAWGRGQGNSLYQTAE